MPHPRSNQPNTVVANNTGDDCDGTIDSNPDGSNWFEDATCGTTADGDPGLGVLADNGGPTQTHYPLPGSGLLDSADAGACTATDQRGTARPDGSGCDIGAVEAAACGPDLALGTQWRQIALPCTPAAPATVASVFGDDLGADDFNNGWVMWSYDPFSSAYMQLRIDDPVDQGVGYWMLDFAGGTVSVDGTATPLVTSPECPDAVNGCFAIDIGATVGLQQVGHGLPYAVSWADVRFASASLGQSYTPSEAQTAGWAENFFYRYTGNDYATIDDVVNPADLVPFDGFWITTLASAPADLQLLIPAIGASAPASQSAMVLAAGADPMLADGSSAATQPSTAEGWSIELVAEADGMRAAYNLLGQHPDSAIGYDRRDLPELAPFSTPYLTLVFPDQGELGGDYTTDFRAISRHRQANSWAFEVRSDQPGRNVTLTWDGPPERLARAILYDTATGEQVRGSEGAYSFTLEAESRAFLWRQFEPRRTTRSRR